MMTLIMGVALSSCNQGAADKKKNEKVRPPAAQMTGTSVTPDVETDPVLTTDDAADDPAIFINFDNPERSFVIGTDKNASLELYYLNGMRRAAFENGEMNNVDIRYNFPMADGRKINLIGSTDRYTNAIKLFTLDMETDMIIRIDNRRDRLVSTMHEVYGFCLYHDIENDEYYGFVTVKSGGVQQWHISANDANSVNGDLVRYIDLSSQTEGCVADDELGWLYVGEEDYGIWKYYAHPDSSKRAILVDDISNPALKADIEGLTIYYAADGEGYLIASSQGNNSYAVYERAGDNRYLGSFTIDDLLEDEKVMIDGTAETDGIDVTNYSLGDAFPYGVFVVQDGYNLDGTDSVNQNFKMVSWDKIAALFDPPLIIDTTYVSARIPDR